MTATHSYIEADIAMNEMALARLEPPGTKIGRYRAPDALVRLLQTLELCAGNAGVQRLPPWAPTHQPTGIYA
jgi:hypothetical protein